MRVPGFLKTEVMGKKTEKFISCNCHGHGLFMDYMIDEHFKELFIIMFGDKGYNAKPNLWQRIKAAAKTLKTGWFPGGEVCLDEEKAWELKRYIDQFITEVEKNEKP